MAKHIPFGPGHPDYDNQLDLFDEVKPTERLSANSVDLSSLSSGSLFDDLDPNHSGGYAPSGWRPQTKDA